MGEVGDLVVARITAVESKRWRADVNGTKVLQYVLIARRLRFKTYLAY
jgi:exosome complex RNA-binding protein Rrp4